MKNLNKALKNKISEHAAPTRTITFAKLKQLIKESDAPENTKKLEFTLYIDDESDIKDPKKHWICNNIVDEWASAAVFSETFEMFLQDVLLAGKDGSFDLNGMDIDYNEDDFPPAIFGDKLEVKFESKWCGDLDVGGHSATTWFLTAKITLDLRVTCDCDEQSYKDWINRIGKMEDNLEDELYELRADQYYEGSNWQKDDEENEELIWRYRHY